MDKWWEIHESNNDERFFEMKRIDIKSRKGNSFYTTYSGDYMKNLDSNPHTNPKIYASRVVRCHVRPTTISNLRFLSFSTIALNIKQ